MANQILLTDVDDTCLDWLDGFITYAGIELGKKFEGRPVNFQLEDFLGITPQQVGFLIKSFNEGDPEFGKLKPLHSAEEYLPRFYSVGYEIVAITSCASNSTAHDLRKKNLRKVFGDIFADVHCIPLEVKTKTEYLRLYLPGIWAEDRLALAIEGLRLGHEPFVFHRPHNRADQGHPLVSWVKNWSEIWELAEK